MSTITGAFHPAAIVRHCNGRFGEVRVKAGLPLEPEPGIEDKQRLLRRGAGVDVDGDG